MESGFLASQLSGSDLAYDLGVQASIYSPEHQSSTLGSKQLERTAEMHPKRRWRTVVSKRLTVGPTRDRGGLVVGLGSPTC
jgi:hypothetical protein